MKLSNQLVVSVLRLGTSLALGLFLSSAAHGAVFSDSANVNVLRELASNGMTVSNTVTVVSGPGDRANTNDGGGSYQTYFGGPATIVDTYALPGQRTVSSIGLSYFEGFDAPATATLEGSSDGGATWFPTPLTTVTSPGAYTTQGFTAATVNALRLTQVLKDFGGNYYNRMYEVQVFADSAYPPPELYGLAPTGGRTAYNYLKDRYAAGAITYFSSPNNTVWTAPESANVPALFNGNFDTNDGIRAPGSATKRMYVEINLDAAYQMDYAVLGSGQYTQWGSGAAEIYTYNGADLDPSGLSGSTIGDLTGQGWVLQGQWTGDTSMTKGLNLLQPGKYNQILLVGGASDRLSGLEMFGFESIPEPSTILLLGLGGLLVWRRKQENRRGKADGR